MLGAGVDRLGNKRGVPTNQRQKYPVGGTSCRYGEVSGGVTTGELINIISACIQHKMTAYEVSLFQMGTHPALAASPIAYQLVNAAELAIKDMQKAFIDLQKEAQRDLVATMTR